LAANILVWRFGEFLAICESIWLQIFLFGEMYDLNICTYLHTFSYIDLLFLSLLMVWKCITSVERVKVEACYSTLLTKYPCKMLKTFTLCGETQGARYKRFKWFISSEKINVLVKLNHLQKFGEFMVSLAMFWSEFGDSFVIPIRQPWYSSRLRIRTENNCCKPEW